MRKGMFFAGITLIIGGLLFLTVAPPLLGLYVAASSPINITFDSFEIGRGQNDICLSL